MKLQQSVYTIRLEDRESAGKQYINVEDNDYSISMKKFLKSYFKNRAKKFIQCGETTARFRVTSSYDEEKDLIEGYFESGRIEDPRDIFDSDTGDHIYTKKDSDIEARRLYFIVRFDRAYSNKYYIIIQRYGQEGIKSLLGKDLQKFFRTQNKNTNERHLKVALCNVVSEEMIIKDLNEATIKEVRLLKNKLSVEEKRELGITGDLKEDKGEYRVSASKLNISKKIITYLTNGDLKNVKSVFPNISFDYDVIKLKLVFGNGNEKTLNLTDLQNYKSQSTLELEIEAMSEEDIYNEFLNQLNKFKEMKEYY